MLKSSLQIPRKVKILLKNVKTTKRSKKTYTYRGKEESKKYWIKREDREKIITFEVRSDNDDLLKLLFFKFNPKKGFEDQEIFLLTCL